MFYRFKLRAGPCRHLIALRLFATTAAREKPQPLPTAIARSVPRTPAARLATQPLSLQLTVSTAAALVMAAQASSVDPAALIEHAWRGARAVVATWQRIASPTQIKSPQTFVLDADVVAELQAEAARLDVSVSNLFEAVWREIASRDGSGPGWMN
jgi:hypothetical protein